MDFAELEVDIFLRSLVELQEPSQLDLEFAQLIGSQSGEVKTDVVYHLWMPSLDHLLTVSTVAHTSTS